MDPVPVLYTVRANITHILYYFKPPFFETLAQKIIQKEKVSSFD